jgi:hypothetical protein
MTMSGTIATRCESIRPLLSFSWSSPSDFLASFRELQWQRFTKSGARQSGSRNAEKEQGSTSTRDTEVASGESSKAMGDVEWIKAGGCDVCLPVDRRRPLDGGKAMNAVVHFVGGVFLGSIPKAAYAPMIEDIVRKGRVIVVATPCAALSSMDHYKAAYEAAFKFQSASTELEVSVTCLQHLALSCSSVFISRSPSGLFYACIYMCTCIEHRMIRRRCVCANAGLYVHAMLDWRIKLCLLFRRKFAGACMEKRALFPQNA